jgi:hypothetical protein
VGADQVNDDGVRSEVESSILNKTGDIILVVPIKPSGGK